MIALVRPITADDLDMLLALAREAGSGFTSLPPDRAVLAAKIARSQASFADAATRPGDTRYLFALDIDGVMRGCCAIEAACGLEEPFYNYHVGLTVQASAALQVYKQLPTLYLANDLTGSSVLCSLFLHPEARRAGFGALLSRARFLFMAAHPQRFATRTIAELRGVSDAQGRSPVWEGLGRHFFSIDYNEAEHIVGRGNKAVIAELMPRHPIYSTLLPIEAQAALGQVHPQTRAARRLLEHEGFRYQHYIDIFDGGPVVEAPTRAIRTLRRSRLLPARIGEPGEHARDYLLATERSDAFRCTRAALRIEHEHAVLAAAVAATLHIRNDEPLRISPA